MQNDGIKKTVELTGTLSEYARQTVKRARVAYYENGERVIDIMFQDHIPKMERWARVVLIGKNLAEMAGEELGSEFEQFANGAKVREWEDDNSNRSAAGN